MLTEAPVRSVAWEKVLDSDVSHRRNRLQWSAPYCFGIEGAPKNLKIPNVFLQPGFSFQALYHQEQHRVPEILYQREEHAHGHAAGSVLAKGIGCKKLVIVGYGIRHENGEGHRTNPSLAIQGMS